jgi:transglutaminase-like putative cysteine protease
MRFRIRHTTRYRYSQAVTLCHNEAHLRPRHSTRQACNESTVLVEPLPAVAHDRSDYFGNPVLHFAVQQPHDTLTVTAHSVVELVQQMMPALEQTPPWESVAVRLAHDHSDEALEAREFMLDSPLVSSGPELALFAAPSFAPGRPLLEAVHDLSQRIHREFVYDPHFTTAATPLADAFALRRGVCQDFAHVAIGCLRSMGLPARYVSGYIESIPPAGAARLEGADASHAWCAVYVPEYGWVDFDPTNDQLVTDQHVTTAWGRDYADVTPLKGIVFGGGGHSLEVEVDMVREEG